MFRFPITCQQKCRGGVQHKPEQYLMLSCKLAVLKEMAAKVEVDPTPRSSSSHSQSAPYTFHPIVTPLPPVQSYTQHMPLQGSPPQSFLQTLPPYDVSETVLLIYFVLFKLLYFSLIVNGLLSAAALC